MMISFIIPVYNGSASIGKCIQHILNQAGEIDLEVIVVNDGSTDSTAKIVSDYPVTLLNRPHLGASATRNWGIAHAAGNYIAMVDADTLIDRNWVLRCLQEKDYDILQTTDLKYYDDSPHIRALMEKIDKNPYITHDNLLAFIGNGTFIPARNRHLIYYDPMYIVGGEDIDLMLNLIDKGVKIKFSYKPCFLHKHLHRSKQIKYLSFIKKKVVFAYGNIRTWAKHPESEYAQRDAQNNFWAMPLYPFLWIYANIRNKILS